MSIGPVDSETGSDHADSIRRDGLMFGASEPGRSRAAGTASTGDAASGTDAPAAAEADGFGATTASPSPMSSTSSIRCSTSRSFRPCTARLPATP